MNGWHLDSVHVGLFVCVAVSVHRDMFSKERKSVSSEN